MAENVSKSGLQGQAHEYELGELFGVTMALAIWGSHFQGRRTLLHYDNSSEVQIMSKCSFRSMSMMVLICFPVMLGMKHNFHICLQHIPSVYNAVADALLRYRNEEFWEFTPDADVKMMPPSTSEYI